jgi:hypothetical protein
MPRSATSARVSTRSPTNPGLGYRHMEQPA